MGIYAAIVSKLSERITWHRAAEGRILYGAGFFDWPEYEQRGQKDFPEIRLWIPDIEEAFKIRRPTAPQMTVNFAVSVERKSGAVPALTSWVEKLLDAIDTAHDGSNSVDQYLDGLLRSPVSAKMANSHAEAISLNGMLSLTLLPARIVQRGTRSGATPEDRSAVATPVIVQNAGEVTITCATAGAAIYFTTDGTTPSPFNGTRYTAPFTPGPCVVKAKAGAWGYLTSAGASLTLN